MENPALELRLFSEYSPTENTVLEQPDCPPDSGINLVVKRAGREVCHSSQLPRRSHNLCEFTTTPEDYFVLSRPASSDLRLKRWRGQQGRRAAGLIWHWRRPRSLSGVK